MAHFTLIHVSILVRTRAAVVLVVGFVVFLPGLLSPYFQDDWAQRAMAWGTFPSPRSAFDLYDLVNDADRASLVESGVLPWWTHPHLVIKFFRPLSSLLRFADFQLSDLPLLHHLHSFVWWCVAVMGARALYREWLSPRAAAIATFVLAVAPCHVVPLAFLANREALVSLAFGAWGLHALVRARLVRATVLFSLALLAGEYAFALGGYVFALAILTRRGRRERATTLATFLVPAVVVLIARATLGFGTRGSGFYRDPFVQTSTFLEGAPRRFASLLVGTWLASDTNRVMNAAPWVLVVFVPLGAGLVAIAIRDALAAHDDAKRRVAASFVAGSFLALVPMVAALPATRLLGVAALGVAPAVASIIDRAWTSRRASITFVFAAILAFFHVARAPVTSFLEARSFRKTAVTFGERAAWLRGRLDGKPADAKVVVARAGWQTVLFSPFAIDPDARMPKRWWVLSLAPHALMLRRGPRSIEIVVARGRGYLPTGAYDVLRASDDPLRTGDELDVRGMHVTVLEGGGQSGPGRVRFDFDEPLESLVWIEDSRDGWRDAPPPQLGFGAPLDPCP